MRFAIGPGNKHLFAVGEIANFEGKKAGAVSSFSIDPATGKLTLVNPKGERVSIPPAAVESIQESATSLMPENLLAPLSPQEERDLFSYLQGDGK